MIIAIALSHWAWYARMVRSLVVSLRQREFILAARLSGANRWRLFLDHLAGAVVPSLLVLATLDIGHMMLHVAGMSFLGLGVSAPTAEWGVMINDARQFIWTQPLQMLWPGLALFISVMAFNLVGRRATRSSRSSPDRGGTATDAAKDPVRTLYPAGAGRPLVTELSLTLASRAGGWPCWAGSGLREKSLTCAAALGVLPPGVRQTAGRLLLGRHSGCTANSYGGGTIATIYAESAASAFNPLYTDGRLTARETCRATGSLRMMRALIAAMTGPSVWENPSSHC
ncbi:Nickel transport system permease protein nikC [Raoultella planticola]|uniref:Nickel transport system permease protein nikC n=1 Tax=Raoultella planticola TaxID=575 RepID=A0A485BB25_RAOPL|nr:Nickel transport system permease protein nikC [Raoultella planticola]